VGFVSLQILLCIAEEAAIIIAYSQMPEVYFYFSLGPFNLQKNPPSLV
jgi:hypothetical protein